MNRYDDPISAEPPFDEAMLLGLFDGDREAVAELLAAAIGAIEADVRRIEAAAATGDVKTLAEAAHSLKGSSAGIGCQPIATLSASIERAARAGSDPGPAPLAAMRAATTALAAGIGAFSSGRAASD